MEKMRIVLCSQTLACVCSLEIYTVRNTATNIGFSPAGITELTMMSLYLKKATQAQILPTNPAEG